MYNQSAPPPPPAAPYAQNPPTGYAPPPPEMRPRLRQQGLFNEVIETLVLIVAIYTLVNLATVRYFIDGPSMEPSFEAGQFLIVSRVHYLIGEPQRGDIAVFKAPGNDDNDPPLIKRVIGLPGDVVELRDGLVYVNDAVLDETYIKEDCTSSRCRDNLWELGADEYFLMGDNRNNSRDSRVFGAVERSRVIGEAVIRYLPIEDVGIVDGYRFPDS